MSWNVEKRRTRRLVWTVLSFTLLLLGYLLVYPAVTAYRLFTIDQGSVESIPFAKRSLQSSNSLVRRGAARGVGRIGPAAKLATPDLLVLMETDCWQVASEAAWALGQLDSPTPEVIAGLASALTHEHGEVRRYAAFSLSQYGPAASAALPDLAMRLDDEHMGYMAARAIGEMGADGNVAIEPLTRLLKNPNFAVRAEAAAALSKLTPLPPETKEALCRLATDEHPFVREEFRRTAEDAVN